MIRIENLCFRYDKRFFALYNINLDIADNQKVLMFSEQELETQTLFRILSKQEKGYKGNIFFNGKNLKEIPLKNLDICYITKQPILLKHKSILYNIAYPLIIRKENKNNALKMAEKLIEKYKNITYKHLLKCNNTQNSLKIENNLSKNRFNNKKIKINTNKYKINDLKYKKIKNLTNRENILISLLRCTIRDPKIIFCDCIDFDEDLKNIFLDITKNSTVLLATNNEMFKDDYKDFDFIKFEGGSITK